MLPFTHIDVTNIVGIKVLCTSVVDTNAVRTNVGAQIS